MKNLNKLKLLKVIIAVMFVVVMSQSFTACKDDNDEVDFDTNSLSGTSWTITENSDEDDQRLVGVLIKFNPDGTIFFYPWQHWEYTKWEQYGENLKITLGEDAPDDYMKGTFIINGKSAIYTYSWYDFYEAWEGEETYIMKLQKK